MKQVTIKNDRLSLKVLNYGAIIHKLQFRKADNSLADMCVSLKSPKAYLNDPFAIGACVGRFAGRLSGGFLELDGEKFPLPNSDGITLHGGLRGFSKRYWNFQSVSESPEKSEVSLSYLSEHLEEGFPGKLAVKVTYTLSGNALIIRHEATTDRPTVVNLTNHSYFKIDSHPLVSHYRLNINAGKRIETDSRLVPTGKILDVSGSRYDFQSGRSLGGIALDTPFLLDSEKEFASRISSAVSAIQMTIRTNQPGLIVYTPDSFAGICMETQNLPDAPKHSHFPDSRLYPGETYVNESHFIFGSTL